MIATNKLLIKRKKKEGNRKTIRKEKISFQTSVTPTDNSTDSFNVKKKLEKENTN